MFLSYNVNLEFEDLILSMGFFVNWSTMIPLCSLLEFVSMDGFGFRLASYYVF